MSKVLRLYNTFTQQLKDVKLSGKLIEARPDTQRPIESSLYICGPTVYSDCHVGHALTYIRADLFRRWMRRLFNVKLITVMNITDIDDKILEQANKLYLSHARDTQSPSSHRFNLVSNKYYHAFLKDIGLIRCEPADLYVRISRQMHLITSFIARLEANGHAYVAPNGDVNFRVSSVPNYVGRVDSRKSLQRDHGLDVRDFALWKRAKPYEPVWTYESACTHQQVPGRPGWHVQCSAIASAVFGNRLDFHYGGKDLIFPHHYNEQACCCAYHQLDTSKTLNVWCEHWLHSGHLVMRDAQVKMSKSLGNVVPINSFVDRSSVNGLRLACVASHYRADIDYNDELLASARSLDHKIKAFVSYLNERIQRAQDHLSPFDDDDNANDVDVENAIHATRDKMTEAVCDDMHLDRGLDAILQLSKLLYSKGADSVPARTIVSARTLLRDWCETCALEYANLTATSTSQQQRQQQQDDIATLSDLLSRFRANIRLIALDEMRRQKGKSDSVESSQKILDECDKVRGELDEYGFVLRDPKATK